MQPIEPTARTVPLTALHDLLFALGTAVEQAFEQQLATGTPPVIAGDTLCELLCNLMEYHPEPVVRLYVQNELRRLEKPHG